MTDDLLDQIDTQCTIHLLYRANKQFAKGNTDRGEHFVLEALKLMVGMRDYHPVQ